MSEPAMMDPYVFRGEILPPGHTEGSTGVICEFCRTKKPARDFDDDAMGICASCLEADILIADSVQFDWRQAPTILAE
ncbi:MAG: hypothetical protein JWL86_6397 [Rhizobium sp.]|nr:hypothetical protein [Rhizobium sp.]